MIPILTAVSKTDSLSSSTAFLSALFSIRHKYLLSKGASINIATHQRRTPLFVAVQQRFENIVELLLQNNADVNLCRKDGVSPLFMAALQNHKKIVQLLLHYKADPNIARIHDNLYPLKSNSTIFSNLCCTATNNGVRLWCVAIFIEAPLDSRYFTMQK
jgi:ankyrin repeat protein